MLAWAISIILFVAILAIWTKLLANLNLHLP